MVDFMASIRSLRLLASTPAAAAAAAAAAPAASKEAALHERRPSLRGAKPAQAGFSSRGGGGGGAEVGGGLEARFARRRGSGFSAGRTVRSSSGRRTRAAASSSLLLAVAAASSSSANSAMAVTEDRPGGNSAVFDKEAMASQNGGSTQPDLMTEFMVNMSCEGCVKSVRNRVEPLEGVKSVNVDLANQVVRILGSASIKSLTSAIEQTGRDVRLIGQGLPSNFAISAAVAEFKGPHIHGVVRFAQLTMELVKIDASFSGLTPGQHAWSINMYGDLTRGAASTGGIFYSDSPQSPSSKAKPMGNLGTLEVNNKGETNFTGTKPGLQVADLIGRAVVVYEDQDNSQEGITAAVIARSAGVGENYKKLCDCDGTVIWDATNSDFVKL